MSSTPFQLLPNAPENEANILILPVPLEQTVSYKKGTCYAPEEILKATDQLEFYEEDMGWSPMKFMNVCVLDAIEPIKHEMQAVFHARLEKITAQLPENNLLIALGGEHSITPALVKARMPTGGHVIQLDAHADLRPSYEGSEYSHACPMYRISEQGYTLTMIGIRSMFETEMDYITQKNITLFRDRILRKPEYWQQLLEHLKTLEGPIWLTIDMDGFDPGYVPGVGTPQPGGLNWYQALEILETIFFNLNITLRGMDIVELIPDVTQVSEMTAAKLMQKAISFWGKAHKFDLKTQNGSQTQIECD